MSDSAESRCEDSNISKRSKDVMSQLDRETDQEILEAKSPLHVMDIARTADCHPITVDRTCARLHERGYIYSVGRGLYDVTDDGTQQISEN